MIPTIEQIDNGVYQVTEKDLIGDIKDFPIEVVQRMVNYQVKQGNKPDVKVFQNRRETNSGHGGFRWDKTEEGLGFWDAVICENNFNLFFQKYPKQNQLTIQKDMETNKKVWIRGVLGRGYEVINELIKLGGNNHGLCGEILDDIYYIGPDNSIEYIRDDIKRAKEIMAEYKEIKLDDSPSITASQDYGLNVSKYLSTFAKTCINLPEGSSVNICNENGKVMIIVEPKQVKEEERRFKDGDIIYSEDDEGRGWISIFNRIEDDVIYSYADFSLEDKIIYLHEEEHTYNFGSIDELFNIRLATKEDIAELNKEFAEQKHLKWNAKEFKFEEYRWRAKEGGEFWFISGFGTVDSRNDYREGFSDKYYEYRNYFQTEELAKKALPLWKEFFKNLSL